MCIFKIVGITKQVVGNRSFTTFSPTYQKTTKSSGSLFGEVSEAKEDKSSILSQISTRVDQDFPSRRASSVSDKSPTRPKKIITDVDFRNDPQVLKFTKPKAYTAPELLLSPLKRMLYELSLKSGGYDPHKVLTLDGKKYKLYLTKQELAALEPSVYLKSYRIKSSYKKATLFLRMLRGMPLKKAITQCNFSSKIIARHVAEMFTRGLDEAKQLKLDVDDLHISQIWVGKDGGNYKRVDFKGRGRAGVIEHKFVHVRAILKTSESTRRILLQRRAKQLSKPIKLQLLSKPIHEFPKMNVYKW